MTRDLQAPGLPEEEIRLRARDGLSALYPPSPLYGNAVFGEQRAQHNPPFDTLDSLRVMPPVLMPLRLEKLIELGREPGPEDVDLTSLVGGLLSPIPVYLSALGSTSAASASLGLRVCRQAGRFGVPIVIGENVSRTQGLQGASAGASVIDRIETYMMDLPPRLGGVVVQQGTQDADAEVWNAVYTHPVVQPLLETKRLSFELKLGQGAKPGSGGISVVPKGDRTALSGDYRVQDIGSPEGKVLRISAAGTFTEPILRSQVVSMRNNYPIAHTWVKMFAGRDLHQAAGAAWSGGADLVVVDAAGAGTGWAPTVLMEHSGLDAREALAALGGAAAPLAISSRMWEGSRIFKAIALGAGAVGIGRAALVAADENHEAGVIRLLECLEEELRILAASVGKYAIRAIDNLDVN